MEFLKIKNFYSSKDTVKEIKRDATDRDKIFAKHLTEKGLASRIFYKELLKLSNMKITQFVKWASDVNKHFTKEHM